MPCMCPIRVGIVILFIGIKEFVQITFFFDQVLLALLLLIEVKKNYSVRYRRIGNNEENRFSADC